MERHLRLLMFWRYLVPWFHSDGKPEYAGQECIMLGNPLPANFHEVTNGSYGSRYSVDKNV